MDDAQIRQNILAIIESESLINGRFADPKRIDDKGGNGFFSLMFKARDVRTQNDVALKFFDPTKTFQQDRVKRFDREAQMLHRLRDEEFVINCIAGPSELVRYTIDQSTGIKMPQSFKYIAMDYADSSVFDLIYSNKLTPLQRLLYYKDMVKAVSRVHSRKICHRDLKLPNFQVVKGNVRLSDFGTAKCMDGSEPDILPSYHLPVGDLDYCPPENFFGLGIADQDVYRSDMFALGAILFEMFTHTMLSKTIYTKPALQKINTAVTILSAMPRRHRMETYRGIAADLRKLISLPDIYAYNHVVPPSIKFHLNELYKSLAEINLLRRLADITSIHRKLDICILILRNEEKYLKWLEEKKKRRIRRLNRKTNSTLNKG